MKTKIIPLLIILSLLLLAACSAATEVSLKWQKRRSKCFVEKAVEEAAVAPAAEAPAPADFAAAAGVPTKASTSLLWCRPGNPGAWSSRTP